jgi:protein-L-isoaspartate(D-aspartate) O-methyltransferase
MNPHPAPLPDRERGAQNEKEKLKGRREIRGGGWVGGTDPDYNGRVERGEPEEQRHARRRQAMVDLQLRARGIADPRVLDAMAEVPRHRFVPEALCDQAYHDRPLPIGDGQTISQPYIVALMTEALELTGDESVLELGTGSGYQTAILACLCRETTTIDVLPQLSQSATARLRGLGYTGIRSLVGDGTAGAPEHAPFDRILATGSLPAIPEALMRQMAREGILVAPIGGRWGQELVRLRCGGGRERRETLCGCRFVPLIGKHGWAC